jgi:cAMP-dependent protein kinase regulator
MHSVPRAANIRASTDSICWSLDRLSFNYYVKNNNIRKRTELIEFLSTVNILSEITFDEKQKLADVFNIER